MRRAPLRETEAALRLAIGRLIGGAPSLRDRPALRHQVGTDLMRLGRCLAELLDADLALTEQIAPRPQATGLAAGDNLGLQANREASTTLRNLKDAIDFPTFVSGLITGVFHAIWQSNIDQMQSIAGLLQAVGSSTTQFASSNVSDADAARFVAQALPGITVGEDGGKVTLNASGDSSIFGDTAKLQSALQASPDEVSGLSAETLSQKLIPLGKRALGRTKQQSLANLVMMGLSRIVVDKGQMHASMDLRVDARSAADSTAQNRLDSRTNAGVSGSAMGGAWGVSGSVSTTVGIVKDNQDATSEEQASSAALRSSVDLVFHTEPIQLDAMASMELRKQIIANTTMPSSWSEGTLLKNENRAGFSQYGAPPEAPPPPDLAANLGALKPPVGGGGLPGGSPGAAPSDAGAAAAAASEPATPEEPKAEEPKAEEPKAEQPKAEEPKPEEPKAEEPKPEQPKPEEPKAEEPKPEQPKPEEPKAEEPKPEPPRRSPPNAMGPQASEVQE